MALTTLPCATALACDISIYTLLYFTLLYFTLLYFTLLYFTLLYFTLLYFTLPYLFFVLLPSLQMRPLSRFARTISQTTRIAPRKCLFGVSSMKRFFHGGISLPQNFQRAFYTQIAKVEYLWTGKR
jgi:hypothetical protein